MTHWGDIRALWLLAGLPLFVVGYAIDTALRRRLLAAIGESALVGRLTASVSGARRTLAATLIVATVALAIVALARPQHGGKAQGARRRGSDVVIALDFSKSMLARDVAPSRIERAKIELRALLDALGGDRIGLVAFAGEALRYPLTTDHAAAHLFWRDLTPLDMPVGGTAIAKAIHAGIELLESARSEGAPSSARSIVLLTDGEETEGGAVVEAAREAARLRIRIFTVGIGSTSGELVPEIDQEGQPAGWQQNPAGGYVMSRLDARALRAIAEATGGEYFEASAGRLGIERVGHALAKVEKREYEARVVRRYEESYAIFLLPAFLLLLVETCIGDRRRC